MCVGARFRLVDVRNERGKCLKLCLNDFVRDCCDFLYSSNMLSKSKLMTDCDDCRGVVCPRLSFVEPWLASFKNVVTVALTANLEK